jgi:hypothetical protein
VLSAQEIRHLNQLAPARPARKTYDNPTLVPRRPRQNAQPLTASDIAWLNRLPSDPSQISYEDAHALARLDADWPSGSPDARLVRSVLGPVRRHHDAQQAQVELDNLKAIPARNIDHGQALSMVSAAVMREVPELTEDEAHTRARDLLTAALDKARAEHAAALDAAQAKVHTASKPYNPTDMADSQAYREMARAAALSGDGTARRAIRDYDAAEAESAVA